MSTPAQSNLKKYACAFSYDVPHYFEFQVEAASEAEAQEKIDGALERGIFERTIGEHCLEDTKNVRCILWGDADEFDYGESPLLDLQTPVEDKP